MQPGLRLLFVGINPGIRSAALGHHFAGHSNRFWKLLYESGLVPEPIGFEDDARLLDFGFGITNLVARPTPGVAELESREFAAGRRILERKVARLAPQVVALVGVVLWRQVFPQVRRPQRIAPGLQTEQLCRSRVFLLPNPSGRNAHYSYADMLAAFTDLNRFVQGSPALRSDPGGGARRPRRWPRS